MKSKIDLNRLIEENVFHKTIFVEDNTYTQSKQENPTIVVYKETEVKDDLSK